MTRPSGHYKVSTSDKQGVLVKPSYPAPPGAQRTGFGSYFKRGLHGKPYRWDVLCRDWLLVDMVIEVDQLPLIESPEPSLVDGRPL